MKNSKTNENKLLKKFITIQNEESAQSDVLLIPERYAKRNKAVLVEKEKLARLKNDIEALKTEVDTQYINHRHRELKKLAIEHGKYERERKEFELLRSMQDEVDESLNVVSKARL
jgi:hypothetical protein